MASTILGNPLASGAQLLVSGCYWSGSNPIPTGGVQLYLDETASGNAYVAFSGNMTFLSGGMFLSGGGLDDGMKLRPGTGYFIPRLATGNSGQLAMYVRHDPACSGQARLWFQVF